MCQLQLNAKERTWSGHIPSLCSVDSDVVGAKHPGDIIHQLTASAQQKWDWFHDKMITRLVTQITLSWGLQWRFLLGKGIHPRKKALKRLGSFVGSLWFHSPKRNKSGPVNQNFWKRLVSKGAWGAQDDDNERGRKGKQQGQWRCQCWLGDQ